MHEQRRILIVDDHADLRLLLQECLDDGRGTYAYREAENGAEALACVASFAPQVVILDVMLPGGMDGYAICQAIKARGNGSAAPHVLMLSACGQQADREKGRAAGADQYLVKPFSPLGLIAAVEQFFSAGQGASLPDDGRQRTQKR
jgi:CheY-like chemotaxis protein